MNGVYIQHCVRGTPSEGVDVCLPATTVTVFIIDFAATVTVFMIDFAATEVNGCPCRLSYDIVPEIVARGFKAIVSNQDVWYLDHLNVPWEYFYLNEPLTDISDPKQRELILGGEVCMWGETADSSDIMATIWPRAAAAAGKEDVFKFSSAVMMYSL